MTKKQKQKAEFDAWYATLPVLPPGARVRCPTTNGDGTPIAGDDVMGCGSAEVAWAGDVYDCCACGIFFSDFAADPPHRRPENEPDLVDDEDARDDDEFWIAHDS